MTRLYFDLTAYMKLLKKQTPFITSKFYEARTKSTAKTFQRQIQGNWYFKAIWNTLGIISCLFAKQFERKNISVTC